ncbi:hypothetical protein D3C84_720520 [compost metagenome]
MGFTLNIHHFVTRQLAGPRLQKLLQTGFRVFVGIDQGQAFELAGQPSQHAFAGGLHVRVEVDCTDQRLKGVSQDRFAAKTTAFQLTGAQAQVFTEVETTGQYGQGLALDQPCAQARQLAFAGLGKALEQRFASDEVKDRIAEKLEAFVVAPGKTAVRQGQQHQLLVLEGVSELALEAAQRNAHSVPTRSSWSIFNALFKSTS